VAYKKLDKRIAEALGIAKPRGPVQLSAEASLTFNMDAEMLVDEVKAHLAYDADDEDNPTDEELAESVQGTLYDIGSDVEGMDIDGVYGRAFLASVDEPTVL